MKTLVLDGPMALKSWKCGREMVTFEQGVPQDVENDAFAQELLDAADYKQLEDGKLVTHRHTVESAAAHCIPVFREVTKSGKGSKGGEVRSDV